MKKLIALCLTFVVLFVVACPVSAAQQQEISPQYANIRMTQTELTILDNGLATVTVTAIANSGVTQIKAVTHIERFVNGRWYLAYIGGAETSWEDISYSTEFSKAYTAQLSSAGTYRAVTEFTVTGTTVETITKTAQAVY